VAPAKALSTKLRIYVSLVLLLAALKRALTWTMRKIGNDRVQTHANAITTPYPGREMVWQDDQ